LAGAPILTRTLRVFAACAAIESIVAVVPPQDLDFCRRRILAEDSLGTRVELVAGGPQRQDSVHLGLRALPATGIALIHDGVRPLVAMDQILGVIEIARAHGACIPALPLSDTVKRISDGGWVEATLARTGLWRAQTPQAFRVELIREAHERARRDGFLGTDDAQLVERLGGRVWTLAGDARNIKITRPEDLTIAEALLTCLPDGA
jgi:2-C-methyl-D-erythritol 4-phosphate cytidylyltransferase